MQINFSITEFKELYTSIQKRPKKLFKMMRQEIRETTGQYLSELIQMELTDFLGRLPYERRDGNRNHRNGYYHRGFTLKGIGEVLVRMARDRKGKFSSQVLPRSKRYEDGRRLVLGFQAGNKESASTWREFFKDLKRRGLRSDLVKLGVMDGLRALEKVFREEFTKAEVQRCQIHVTCNVLAKVPAKLKKEVADDLRSIFYAPSLKKAKELFQVFGDRWEREIPSAVKCLARSIDSCLTFFKFPP